MIGQASGYRYWTMIVDNLEDIVDECVRAGRDVVVPIKEIRKAVWIAIVADPDGNLVEFVRYD